MRIEFGPKMAKQMGIGATIRYIHTVGAMERWYGFSELLRAEELPFSLEIAQGLWREGWNYAKRLQEESL